MFFKKSVWRISVKKFTGQQCCGSGMFIQDPNFSILDPDQDFLPSRISDPDLQHCWSKIYFMLLLIGLVFSESHFFFPICPFQTPQKLIVFRKTLASALS